MSSIIKKLRFRLPKSIKTQLILGIAFVHLFLMAIFVVDLVYREEQFLKKQNLSQTINLAESFAVNSANYILTDDFYYLERITQSYKDFPALNYAMILSLDNEVLAHTEEKHVGTFLTDPLSKRIKPQDKPHILVNDSNLLDLAVPIKNNEKIIGWARIGINQDNIRENLRNIVFGGILYILIALVLGSVFAIIFANFFSKGLYKLVAAAKEIKAGDRNKRIGDLESNELNDLGEALNSMLEDIVSNEALLNLVLKNMPVGVWILDPQGNITSHNPAAKEIWKDVKFVGPEEYGQYKAKFVDTDQQVEPDQWGASIAINEKRAVMDQVVEIECFDGSTKTIINSAIPMKDKKGNLIGVLVLNVDITDRRKLELEREKMVTNLLQRNRDLEQFSYIVSHNIRGPLSTLLGICDLLKLEISEEDKQMAIDGIQEQSNKLDAVITDLNSILNAKKEASQPKETVYLDNIIQTVMGELSPEIENNQATVDFDFSKATKLNSVKSYLHNIFLNLISNSIKFRKPDANPEIKIWSERQNGHIKIYFEDNGVGIDMKRYRNQVFGLYKRFSLSTTGKGMGLFMIKSQINALGGSIDLESIPQKGTTFIVTLPAAKDEN